MYGVLYVKALKLDVVVQMYGVVLLHHVQRNEDHWKEANYDVFLIFSVLKNLTNVK